MRHRSVFRISFSQARQSHDRQSQKTSHSRQVKAADTWDLASLFPNDAAWETAFAKWEKRSPGTTSFAASWPTDAKTLAGCLKFDIEFDRAGERLGTYAFLKTAEDTANSDYQRMIGRYRNVASRAAQAASYHSPGDHGHSGRDDGRVPGRQGVGPVSPDCSSALLRYKPHTLGKNEEKLLAMQTEMSEAANQVFRQLTDADLKWGMIKNERGELVELSNSSFSAFLHSPDAHRAEEGVSPVLQAVRRAREHAGRGLERLRAARRVLRPGPQLPQRLGRGAVSRQRAAVGVRQSDRLGPSPPAGPVSLLRSAAAEDEAAAIFITTTPTCRS